MKFKIFVIFAVIFTAVGLTHHSLQQQQQPINAKRGPASDINAEYGWPHNCNGKKYCITVFVAPWCPICKGSQPTFKMLQQYLAENRTDVGFGLVMSTGTPDTRRAEKSAVSPVEVTIDDTEIIMRNRRIDGFPTWIVNDGSGNEVFNKSGARTVRSASELPGFLSDLNID